MSYVHIDTPATSRVFEVETVEEALDEYARAAGYDSYAELASTLGKSVEEAKVDLAIECVTTADVSRRLWDAVEDCHERGLAMTDGGFDFGNLPTYGSTVAVYIGDAVAIWSWDEAPMLVDRRFGGQRFIVPGSAYADAA